MHGHGEYKVPGGKLVVADVAIAGGRLVDVAVSGDFFLEPDFALAAINAALQGQSIGLEQEALAGIVRRCLPVGTRMFGVDADGFAVAVRRAIDNGGIA
ncbi:biotin--protein ligase [Thermomonas sp.]|uniref:biotin--protein ligase n=1 Tax=Thermomonas sp. TaxID=1971895 RepID=UPI0026239A03|nr:biotin--protein ligase [Thermomonas sp.]